MKQATSKELLDALCEFIRRKFYPEHAVSFAKDRPRLLKWVILYPAGWLNSRGVTLPADRYRQILEGVLMDALRFGKQSKVIYIPAYLRYVVQSHFAHHGDEIYAEAKNVRNLVEHAIVIAGRAQAPAPDPVRDLAAAAKLLRAKKVVRKTASSSQLPLFG